MGFLKNLCPWLFDFSAGQAEGRRMERLFRVALAETTSEAEFCALCYRMLQEDDYLKTQVRWVNVMEQLSQFRSPGQKDWRVPVRQLIAFLPRHYGYESVWETNPDAPN